MRRVARHSAAIALTAPQVVAHRLARMALAGPFPGARDQLEFTRMGAEKVAAFYESWHAMYAEGWRIQQEAWAAAMRAAWFPWQGRAPGAAHALAAWQRAATRMLAQGMAPVSRRTSANARRLRTAKRRRR